MSDILSQEEVDSLLEGITDGKVETETDNSKEKEEVIKTYDFTTESVPVHQRMPAFSVINERCINYLRSDFSNLTGSIVDINIVSTESLRFKDFIQSLPIPSSLNIFKIEPLRGHALVVIEGRLVFMFVDTLFGGKGTGHVKLEGRGFTQIETKIIEKITQIILSNYERAWSDIIKVHMVFIKSEMDPKFAEIATSNDVVIVTKIIVDIQNNTGSIILCIPYSIIEPIRNRLKYTSFEASSEEDKGWRDYLLKQIMDVDVDLRCILGKKIINGRDLLKIKKGDLFILNQKTDKDVFLYVEGIPKYKGRPGIYNNHRAIKITEIIQEE